MINRNIPANGKKIQLKENMANRNCVQSDTITILKVVNTILTL